MVSEEVKHFLVEHLMMMMSSVKPLTSLVQKIHLQPPPPQRPPLLLSLACFAAVVLGLAAAVEEEEEGFGLVAAEEDDLGLVAVEVVGRCLQLQVMVVVIAKEREVNSMESDEIVSRHFHSVTHDQQNLHGVSVVVMMMKSHHCLVILVVTC
jgi:hypothetical protein